MFSTFNNFLRIPELRRRLLFTLALIFVARVGANIPLPGVDPSPLRIFFADQAGNAKGGGLVGLYNMFTGGALLKGAIFGLGIMPYISASIIMQLLGVVLPSLAKLQQEGDIGRYRIAQYTRYLSIIICVIQGFLLIAALANYPGRLFQGFDPRIYGDIVIANRQWFFVTSTLYLTAGSLFLVWIGDQISQKGIGSGISLLIVIGILSSMPRGLYQAFQMFLSAYAQNMRHSVIFLEVLLMLGLLIFVILSMVAVTQGQRKIPIQYAKRLVGNRMYSAGNSFLPLKVNYAGVMPIIFGSALLLFPQQIFAYLAGATGVNFFGSLAYYLSQGSSFYYIVYGGLIFAFSYLWVSMMFRPSQVADELKKNGGYIPGIRPGAPTAKFLDFTMTRLTFAGAVFLTVIAVLPDFLYFSLGIPYGVALFFGGTGTLITVGVFLEMMRQVETYLVQRNYDGFMRKERSRYAVKTCSHLDDSETKALRMLWIPLFILFLVGILSWLVRKL